MASPKYAAMTAPKGSMISPNNDTRHNLTDDNKGGSPRGGKGTLPIPPARRGGFGQNGRDIGPARPSGGGRGSAGNPASRGGTPRSFTPDKRIPGHGGSPQKPNGTTAVQSRGGFGHSGQRGLPSMGNANPAPSAGNTSGRSYRLIAGRFKRAAMGAKPTGGGGKYGSPPVTANT